jgi:hypothetical protein
MLNVIIIPPEDIDKADLICELAKSVKAKFPECCISTLVTVKSYDYYYKSDCIDGFIIEPVSLWRKIFLFEPGQFYLAIFTCLKPVWFLACWRAKIKNKIFLSQDNLKEKDFIEEKLSKLEDNTL